MINYKKNSKIKYQISKTSVKLKDVHSVLNFELGFGLLVLIFNLIIRLPPTVSPA
jgi:hypothetical protein